MDEVLRERVKRGSIKVVGFSDAQILGELFDQIGAAIADDQIGMNPGPPVAANVEHSLDLKLFDVIVGEAVGR